MNVTDGNTSMSDRPILDVAFDPTTTTAPIAYAAAGGFNFNTPSTPGHVFRVECTAGYALLHVGSKSGNLPRHPGGFDHRQPELPAAGLRGHGLRALLHGQRQPRLSNLVSLHRGASGRDRRDMQIDRGGTTLSLWTRSRGAYAWPAARRGRSTTTRRSRSARTSRSRPARPGTADASIDNSSYDVDDDPLSLHADTFPAPIRSATRL